MSANFSYAHAHTHVLYVTRCGSTTHLKVSHRDCPLNPKRVAPDNPSGRESAPPRQKKRTQETQVDSDAESHTSVGSEDSEDSDDIVLSKRFPGAVKPFPYPVGTRVAVEFGDDIYSGTISKLYPGEDLCEVIFTDGDKADYEADQITYAKQLYEHKFLGMGTCAEEE